MSWSPGESLTARPRFNKYGFSWKVRCVVWRPSSTSFSSRRRDRLSLSFLRFDPKHDEYRSFLTCIRNEHMFTNDFVDQQERGFTVPRPFCTRRISCWPEATYFKPAGVPLRVLDEITLTLDELEALRLADLNGMYQEQAAQRMKISRPTFARIAEAARKKVADALVHGKALRLEGGPVRLSFRPRRAVSEDAACARRRSRTKYSDHF